MNSGEFLNADILDGEDDIPGDRGHFGKRVDSPAWNLGMGLAQSYAVGETAIIFEASIPGKRHKLEIVCGSDAFWRHREFNNLIELGVVRPVCVNVGLRGEGNFMFVGISDFTKESKNIIASKMAFTCPPWLKPFDDCINPGCCIFGAANKLLSVGGSRDLKLTIEVVGVHCEWEIGFGSTSLAVKANRGSIDRLVKCMSGTVDHAVGAPSDRSIRTWESHLNNLISSLRFEISHDAWFVSRVKSV